MMTINFYDLSDRRIFSLHYENEDQARDFYRSYSNDDKKVVAWIDLTDEWGYGISRAVK